MNKSEGAHRGGIGSGQSAERVKDLWGGQGRRKTSHRLKNEVIRDCEESGSSAGLLRGKSGKCDQTCLSYHLENQAEDSDAMGY